MRLIVCKAPPFDFNDSTTPDEPAVGKFEPDNRQSPALGSRGLGYAFGLHETVRGS